MIDDLEGISVFLAVAEARNFRLAGERLGVTRSAVSQALQRLEDRVGVALVQRTTRSVSLTEAGEVFFEAVRPSVRQVKDAMQTVREMQARPSGLLRITVSSIAESFLSGTLLAGFIEACPDVKLDIVITDEEFDIVEAGFDAGVRLGEVIEQDMIAISVSEKQRQCPVASPAYLERCGHPRHPRDLQNHACIGWRPRPDTAPYRWEFTENHRDFDVAVDPAVTTNDMGMMIRLACAGAGITFGMVETFQPYFDRGELVPLLEDFCPPFPGFYLYYPRRQRQPLKLRALVDYVRRAGRR
ncbi:DNA-binding transcriptional LysR family regulator [Rhizobium pisi]|uniref:HTH-type transcriptional regulator TtuA n=1 Tax=Rhizobium pisi TaxID=574561 RepID=A0A427N8B6_9HYPH|nr:LysR family transcriptional regulator [Rhizobium pisi]MBB3132779.1 DNA-binding transcriptional LysR family regulator [Rhizobium pisi]RSB86381.1 LysR family transcriptional regulator [Rhizobium pisi]TCA63162.1 LysR family transcriptional regulator [Rhizobium pisi]